jgi:predicted N-formylglutamate amidohydrolase
LIVQRFSRLAYDCNRPPESPGAYPERSEIFEISGQCGAQRRGQGRAAPRHCIHPFHQAIDAIDRCAVGAGRNVVLATVHSFTPVYFGTRRDGALGILHDTDRTLADSMLEAAAATGT